MPINYGRLLVSGIMTFSLLATCESCRPDAERATNFPKTNTLPATAVVNPVDSTASVPDSAVSAPPASDSAAMARTSLVVREYRRYVGTVGTVPVVLELTGADSIRGSYYYQGRGGLLTLSAARPAAGQPLVLRETDDTGSLTGRWQTQQPFGPTLRGAWRSPDGRRQFPFALREDYAGAVRYSIETYSSYSKSKDCGLGDGRTHITSEEQDVVYLRPHLTAAEAKVQRQLLPAPHSQLQQYFDKQLRSSGACRELKKLAWVTYNADFLLSIQTFEHEFNVGTPHPVGYYYHTTFDLRTGRPLELGELLRAGFKMPLRRLLSAHLRTDSLYVDFYRAEIEGDSAQTRWPLGPDGEPLAPLPQNGYYLMPSGIGFQYDMYEIAPYVYGPILVEISYREIKPLLRPDGPLAQLLQRRGLR
ncbi:RsiV family protein [Hymenobacter weizhouensis]|uniref:RsiV family protein n=1 Tax=Hymenobacter sp. YIM 151500-1 TaxID=2987689 RepID=UPI002225DFFF|nr:RsiV family protein [Hymenobacter sp. YIM 151500-1]UYZ61790.1 RsiV family protein [Hymenobacter sp. YIM 151500-1]